MAKAVFEYINKFNNVVIIAPQDYVYSQHEVFSQEFGKKKYLYIIKNEQKEIDELEQEIKKLKEERRQTVKKSKKLIDEVNDFQENLGRDIVPMQKIGVYLFFIITLRYWYWFMCL